MSKYSSGSACPQWAAALALGASLCGCTVGPNYKRPSAAAPQQYRDALAPDVNGSASPSIGENDWRSIFTDPELQSLLAEALSANPDLKITAERILEAQAQAGIVQSEGRPSVSAGGSYSALQLPSGLLATDTNIRQGDFLRGGGPTASAAWNLDFWGLYRRQTEAARADLLQAVWVRRASQVSLIENVAYSYFRLRSLDEQLEVTNNTIKARHDSLELTQLLEQYGAGSRADTRQAEELLHTAEANLPEIRRQIAVEENTISTLLGHPPAAVKRGRPVGDQPHPVAVPAGLPSELLERRPDIRAAEAALIAANARVGAARALYFPQISLTSLGGAASNQLTSIFAGANSYWYAAGSLTQPLFAGGRIHSNYRFSLAQRQEMLEQYRKSVLDALRDVSNATAGYREARLQTEAQASTVASAADAVSLARLRYSGGNTSYIEVLTTDTDLYEAQLRLAQAQAQEAASLVDVYGSLGGGWSR